MPVSLLRRILVVTALLASSIGLGSISQAQTPDPIPVKIGWAKFANNAQLVLMKEQAKALGLDIQLVEFQRFPELRVALASGAIDVGTIGPIDVVLGAAAGNDIVVIAGSATGSDLLAKRVGLGRISWDDIKAGKYKLGSFGAGIAWIKTAKTLDEKGIDIERIPTVKVAGSLFDMVQTLRQKSADIAMGVDPYVAQAVAEGYAEYADELDINSSDVGSQNTVLAVTGSFAKKPEAMDRLLRGYLKVLNQMKSNRALWVDTYCSYSGLEKEVALHSLDRMDLTERIDQAGLKKMAAFLLSKGILQKDVSSTVGNYYSYELISKITGKGAHDLGASD
jgi:ABC-type nitrate/sulfonate/bicarbonate transport system substrate-binding protein